jgi:phenylalanyl-tRNA synthetase beta chain
MPTISVQRHDLYRLADLPPDYPLADLDDQLALVKGELGGRTQDGLTLRTIGGWVSDAQDYRLRIELKDTNRPDLWSVEGIARQLRDHRRGYGRVYDFFDVRQAERTIEVDPALQEIRPFIGGFLAEGGTVDEANLLALIETQETLTRNFGRKRKTVSIGLYGGEGLLFPVRYQAVGRHETRFAPLPPTNAPDWAPGALMTPQEILDRHPTGREYADLLTDQARVPLLTDATGAVLALIPIINSAGLGRVTPGMRALFVEMTGTEQEQVLLALNILATNLADRGWRITPVATRYPYDTPRGRVVVAPHAMPITQRVPVADFARLLGERVTGADVVQKLHAYGVFALLTGEQIAATIPSYRQDYLHAVDVVEDYAISRGYATITPMMPQEFTIGHLQPLTEFEDLVRDLLIGFGFEEAICNILSSEENLRQRMAVAMTADGPQHHFHGGPTVHIGNVMNLNYAHLRDWLIPSLLEIEERSGGAIYPHRLFEVGEVAVQALTENYGARHESRLAAFIADEAASFDAAQSVLYALLGHLGLQFTVTPWQHPSFIAGRVALVMVGENALGFLGELSPQVLTNWGARVPIAALELSLNGLMDALAV